MRDVAWNICYKYVQYFEMFSWRYSPVSWITRDKTLLFLNLSDKRRFGLLDFEYGTPKLGIWHSSALNYEIVFQRCEKVL
jgi:hypothetical protein